MARVFRFPPLFSAALAFAAAALSWAAQPLPAALVIQLRVVEGEGAVYAAGGRATHGLTVLVTGDTGSPVEDAAVSFALPSEGPSGAFPSGGRTEVVRTGPDGKASVWGMHWNRTPGPLQIRITAVKDQARAGLVSTQYLSDAIAPKGAGGEGSFASSHHGRTKWILISAVAAGAVAGLALGRAQPKTAAAAPVSAPPQIGAPSITVGAHP